MTATPPIIAGTPGAGPDVLSEILRGVRLTGSVFLDGRFTAPFGVISPQRWDGTDVVAHLRHISTFHLIARGGCTLETADGEKHDVGAGDILLLPFTAEHRFWQGKTNDFGYAPDLVQAGPIPGVDRLCYGGGGDETRFVC